MYNIIFILGSQGVGKTTISRLLKEKLNSVYVDFDWIRGYHLDKNWTNATPIDEKMSIENLVFLLKNYQNHGYKNIIASGFTESNFVRIMNEFKDIKHLTITLYISDDDVLKERILTESRDSGFRDFEESIKFNSRLRDELHFPNEQKIDNTKQTPTETINQILEFISI